MLTNLHFQTPIAKSGAIRWHVKGEQFQHNSQLGKMTPVHRSNSYQSPKKQCLDEVTPDSTTQAEKLLLEFIKGQEVLAKQKDGRYYFGTIVEVDAVREQCLVKYGDNTQNWSTFKDVTKLSTALEQEDLLCVICKKSSPKNEKQISVCDRCGRGYHKKCHQPEITSQKEDSNWMCKRCLDSDPNRLRKSESKPPFRRDSRNSTGSSTQETMPSSTTPKVLLYDLSTLSWDTYHRVNEEQIYCYCGDHGEWYKQMLQCGRCKQWFHEKCIDCLQFPLYCGDRFYVFVCAICNHGKEFVRRLEIKWVDLVHLMLFNLTVHHCKKYYDLDTVVIPYISDNWHALQLGPKMANVTKLERRENILSVLTNNRNRFKCGREIKKRTTIWGLRVRLPPPVPCIVLPQPQRKITDVELKELWQGNRRLQFLAPPTYSNNRKIVSSDSAMRNIMLGVAYQQSTNHSENESPCPSPDMEKEDRIIPPPLFSIAKPSHNKDQYLGAGCAKKTAPFKKMSLQRRKKLLAMTNRERDRILKRPRRLVSAKSEGKGKSSEPKPAVELPPTPPTSVSAPPTPPASTGGGSLQSDFSNEFSEGSSQVKGVSNKKQTFAMDLELNTPCDTSSDETSSKSTLDLIIPPPKDFEGKNNPFLTLLKMGVDEPVKKKRGKDITLPLPLKTVIPGQPVMRPMKRQLSEKDIIVGPNGEIKRKKRLRRNRSNVSNYGIGQTASKTATVTPAKSTDTNAQLGNSLDYSLNVHVRRLRQRPEKPPDKEPPPSAAPKQPTPKHSPVKTEPDIDMEDLKTSVNMYFGAVNRIAAGERFTVRAKRIGPTGKLECLIEWEGPGGGQGMT
ncbi:PHD finger protein 19 isoform X1 [Dendroctonus ponderosae]|uniref:PHD finger protein 19 isoform X1 n=1 Tax=Dendroctonus ponderosae TaxID=77166 RepID=UPI002034FE8F|nr:PHD finger protein 19 isoform X1 [Dendroctonus ponderosae]